VHLCPDQFLLNSVWALEGHGETLLQSALANTGGNLNTATQRPII
jgi:hypothetical protein